MTIQVGDRVCCVHPDAPEGFPGMATVRAVGAPLEFVRRTESAWLQVERDDGESGGGDEYNGHSLWIIQARYLRTVGLRTVYEPPTRYGPHKPTPKALP